MPSRKQKTSLSLEITFNGSSCCSAGLVILITFLLKDVIFAHMADISIWTLSKKQKVQHTTVCVPVSFSLALFLSLSGLYMENVDDHHVTMTSCAMHHHDGFFSTRCLALNGCCWTSAVNGLFGLLNLLFECVTFSAIHASIITRFCAFALNLVLLLKSAFVKHIVPPFLGSQSWLRLASPAPLCYRCPPIQQSAIFDQEWKEGRMYFSWTRAVA